MSLRMFIVDWKFLATACLTFMVANDMLAQSYGDYAVRIEVEGNGFAHFTTIYFDDQSWDPNNVPTYGWDPCCDALLIVANANQPHVFTNVVAPPEPANSNRLSINGLPHVYEHTPVPMGFLPGELASYLFTFKELYTLPVGMTVELEDLSLNVTQDLLADSTYDTWSSTSDDENRFIVHFYPGNITGVPATEKSEEPQIITDGSDIKISRLRTDRHYEFTVYDMLGREVEREHTGGSTDANIRIEPNINGILDVHSVCSDGREWSRMVYVW